MSTIPIQAENAVSTEALKSACARCNLRELCVPGGIPAAELEKLDTLIAMRRKIKKGELLFRSATDFRSLYAVRSGFFKTSISSEDGREQITGFHLAGELMGLDGVASDLHSVDATALEDSEVCVLPFRELEKISRQFAPLQEQLHKVMSREIVREHGVLMLLGSMKAEERTAAFLLNLSERYVNLGYSGETFLLRMTRQEMGNYLGLKLETVSRALSAFAKQQLIATNGKEITILDKEGLRSRISLKCS